jgi:hypothetical protein
VTASPRADRGRAEVYAAELMAFDGTELEVVVPFDQLAGSARHIVSGGWWPVGPVGVMRARRDAHASTTRSRSGPGNGTAVIRLAASQCTQATLAHELAHVLVGVGAGHGSGFRRAHVDVATVMFGIERAAWLTDAYAAAGLALADRTWPAPPPGHMGSIAR